MCHAGVNSPRRAWPTLRKAVGVRGGSGKATQEVLTPRRKSSAALRSFRGCQQLRLCLGLVRAPLLEREGKGGRGTISLLLP